MVSTFSNFYYHNGVVTNTGKIKLYLEYMNKFAKGIQIVFLLIIGNAFTLL